MPREMLRRTSRRRRGMRGRRIRASSDSDLAHARTGSPVMGQALSVSTTETKWKKTAAMPARCTADACASAVGFIEHGGKDGDTAGDAVEDRPRLGARGESWARLQYTRCKVRGTRFEVRGERQKQNETAACIRACNAMN